MCKVDSILIPYDSFTLLAMTACSSEPDCPTKKSSHFFYFPISDVYKKGRVIGWKSFSRSGDKGLNLTEPEVIIIIRGKQKLEEEGELFLSPIYS